MNTIGCFHVGFCRIIPPTPIVMSGKVKITLLTNIIMNAFHPKKKNECQQAKTLEAQSSQSLKRV